MDRPRTTKLYKYLPVGANSLAILIRYRIWYPTADTFNDPFDCRAVEMRGIESLEKRRRKEYGYSKKKISENSSTEDKLHNLFGEYLCRVTDRDKQNYKLYSSIIKGNQDLIYSFGVLSLSSTFKEILLWSHYADHHSGFCIEFERNSSNQLGKDALPVSYDNCRLRDLEPNDTNTQSDIFNRKYKKWSYEKEWRVFQHPGNRLYDLPGRIRAVIIGAKMEHDRIEILRKIINDKNRHIATKKDLIKVKYAVMDPEQYKININT